MREDLPLTRRHLFGVDRHDDALVADLGRGFRHQIRVVDGSGVHAHLVRTRIEQAAHIGHRAHPAADGEGNEHLRSTRFDDMQNDVALVRRRRNIQKGHFIGALRIVAPGDLDRIACIPQINKIGALDDPASGDIKAGNNTFCQPQGGLPSKG